MTVHFVGAGPGAADLLTLRAVALLETADLVLYPGTYLDGAVLDHCRTGARLIDTQELDLNQISDLLTHGSRGGLSVVRLTSGDPSVYSALSEQTARLDAAGIPWDVTPGVPAYAAAAALIGRELTVPFVAQSVVLTRTQARSSNMPESEALATFAATKATLVLHLAITRIRELMTEIEAEYGGDCPVVVVYRASQPEERVLAGTIATIADLVDQAGFRQAAIILVGRALARDGGESWLYTAERVRRRTASGSKPTE